MGANDAFYRFSRFVLRLIFTVASRPIILHAERTEHSGGVLLAANHTSPYDVACLMSCCRRRIDFVSIVELMDRPLVGVLFRALNCMALDRQRMDSVTARQILQRLRGGRMVGMFPEGGVPAPQNSVLRGGPLISGIGQLAQLTQVPIIPSLTVDTKNFSLPGAWLPLRRTRYALAFGEPLYVRSDLPTLEARTDLEDRWQQSLQRLEAELQPLLDWKA